MSVIKDAECSEFGLLNLSTGHTGRNACQVSHVNRHTDNLEYPGRNDCARKGLETVPCDEQLKELGKEKRRGDEVIVSNYIKGFRGRAGLGF